MSKNLWVRSESNHYNSVVNATVFWTIDDFMGRGYEENDKSILSQTFRVKHANFEETKWQIQVFPRGDMDFMDGQGLPPSDATLVKRHPLTGDLMWKRILRRVGHQSLAILPLPVRLKRSNLPICPLQAGGCGRSCSGNEYAAESCGTGGPERGQPWESSSVYIGG